MFLQLGVPAAVRLMLEIFTYPLLTFLYASPIVEMKLTFL